MPKESTYDIKFYKLDSSQNYTYPRGNNISIIKNSYEQIIGVDYKKILCYNSFEK